MDFFKNFQVELSKKNIPYVGLTGLEVGKYGCINSMEKWRINDLRKLGIDLSCHKFNNYKIRIFFV
jgi:hypothetical protein